MIEKKLMPERKLTMIDIAELAGVGKSTVSRYFNGGCVRADTRDKIKKICDEYDYHPNQAARLMKAKRTYTIGVISPTLTSHTSARTITVMDDYLRENGYTSVIINANHSAEKELDAFGFFSELNVDAVVILATNDRYNYDELMCKYHKPILFMGQEIKGAPSVVYDDYNAGYAVGKRAAETGCKNVTYLGVDESDISVGVLRRKGVFDALKDAGIENAEELKADFEYDKCLPIVRNYLAGHKPDVIVCATDRMAIACYKVMAEMKLSVPDDISLLGFGSYRYGNLLNPPLESIRFHNQEAGELCAKTILKMLDGENVPLKQLVEYDYIEGGSVKKSY